MIRPDRNPRGFTLLEMVVAMAALGFALSAAMYIFIGVNNSAGRVNNIGDTQEAARLALDILAADIRMSGAAASSGQVGIGATNSGAVARIPTIYSGPDITVTTSGGEQVVTNSIFVISSEPGAGVPSSDGTGMLGSVASRVVDTVHGIQVECTNQAGTQVDCTNGTFQDNTIVVPATNRPGYQPLLVGDYVNGVYLRPTSIGPIVGGAQELHFAEMSIPNAYSPDPKAPFGFAQGANIGKARVTHWYLRKSTMPGGEWELVRSSPILDDSWTPASGCNGASPFIDETNSPDGPPGIVMGSGPIDNLQIRYIVDDQRQDNPAGFHVWGDGTNGGSNYRLGICDTLASGVPLQQVLREVRVSVVARSRRPDRATNGTTPVKRYGLTAWEGVGPSGGTLDEYPRRTFEARIVPRALQGILRL
jgi:prepilin-type N-terminal cleavage/methylation domain-containing protein